METDEKRDIGAEIEALATEIGLTMECSTASGEVDKQNDDWPCIAYTVTLKRNGRTIWAGPYRLGVGHVNWKKRPQQYGPNALTATEEHAFNTMRDKPGAKLKDKQLWADVSAKLARDQKVSPTLPMVLHSLSLDSSAMDATFEDWAMDYGYDTDSRKAEATYRACLDSAIKLRAGLGDANLSKLRELAQDY